MVATVGRCYTNPQDYAQENYYTTGDALSNAEWFGEAANIQGLTEQIQEKHFHNAYQALDPQGNPLRKQQNYRKQSKRQNRPGTDVTLSAPKSISVAALVMGNSPILEAHKSAVRATMDYVEKYCIFYQTKQQGQKKLLQSNTAQIAIFHHDDNRNKDPQLHSHCVILNQTQCPDGKWRAVANAQLYIQQKTIGAYYAHELAGQLKAIGWEVEWTDDHTFELAGVNKEKLDAIFSTRSNQIEAELAKLGLTRKTATAEQKQALCLKTRKEKRYHLEPEDRERQLAEWKQKATEAGIEMTLTPRHRLENTYQQPSHSTFELDRQILDFEDKEDQGDKEDKEKLYTDKSPLSPHTSPSPLSYLTRSNEYSTEKRYHPGSIPQLIHSATEILTERTTAFHSHELLKECLRQSQGNYDAQEIQSELAHFSQLIPTHDGRLTTQGQLKREQKIIQLVQQAQDNCSPLTNTKQVQAISQTRGLNRGQTAALNHIATSRNAVVLVQGNAGVGKTYTMKAFKDLIDGVTLDKGQGDRENSSINAPPVQIRGLAPSAAAADVLQAESGISSQTLASYLLTPNEQLPNQEILLVDEAGMLSTKQMEQLLEKTKAKQSRLILLGDSKQLSAVEAGAPFKLLQDQGLPTSIIDQNLRQRDSHLKQVVDLMATHDQDQDSVNQAYLKLDEHQKIRQIPRDNQRIEALTQDYLTRSKDIRDRTLILAGTNADKQAITQTVRQGLIEEGTLGQESLTLQTLKRKDIDKFALTQAHAYQRGDVIKFKTESAQFSRDFYYRVTEVNPQANTLTLIDTTGVDYTLPLNKYKQREVYQVHPIEIRPGEQMRFTKNIRNQEQNQLNGQRFTIEGVTEDSQIVIQTKGKTQTLAPNQLLHSDYRYVDTVHSSQGQTANYCIYAASSAKSLTVGRESFYVAASRAKQEFVVYTANAQDLGVTVQVSRANENALDLISTASQPEKSSQNTVAKPTTHPTPSPDENPSNSSLGLTIKSTQNSEEGDERKQQRETTPEPAFTEQLQRITNRLTSSSRQSAELNARAIELGETLRSSGEEPERESTNPTANHQSNQQFTRNSDNSSDSPPTTEREPGNRQPSSDEAERLRREFLELEERARKLSQRKRKALQSPIAVLRDIAAQFKQTIEQFTSDLLTNPEDIDEQQVWGDELESGRDYYQTDRIYQEYLGHSPGRKSSDLGIQPNSSPQSGNSSRYQRSRQQQRNSSQSHREKARPVTPRPKPSPQPLNNDAVLKIAGSAVEAIKRYGKGGKDQKTFNNPYYQIQNIAAFETYGWRHYLTITAKDGRGSLLILKGNNNNPAHMDVLENRLSQKDVKQFSEIQAALDYLQQVGQLKQNAQRILWQYGSRDPQNSPQGYKFEGKKYRLESDSETFRIIAKDGRGEILNYPNDSKTKYPEAKAKVNFTQQDVELFREVVNQIEQQRREAERRWQRQKEQQRERGLER